MNTENARNFCTALYWPQSAKVALLLCSTILITYASLVSITTILFIVGIKISPFNLLVAFIVGIIFFWVGAEKVIQLPNRMTLVSLSILVLIISICFLVAGTILDQSWDGQDYHHRAIQKLTSGWDPITSPLFPKNNYYHLILNNYAKAPWYASASIGSVTPNPEVAKGMNILMLLVTTGVVYSSLSTHPRLRGHKALILGLLVGANPVSLCQTLNFYIDGQVASIVAIVLFLFYLLMYTRSSIVKAAFISSIVLAINIKFTSAVYVVVFLFGLIAGMLVVSRVTNTPVHIRSTTKITLLSILTGVIVGFNPYVTNLINRHNLLYPVFGSSAIDVLAEQSPSDFSEDQPIKNLFKSLLSPSANIYGFQAPPLKLPFTFSKHEIEVFQAPDVRIGGFGPLFGFAFLLSIGFAFLLPFVHKCSVSEPVRQNQAPN